MSRVHGGSHSGHARGGTAGTWDELGDRTREAEALIRLGDAAAKARIMLGGPPREASTETATEAYSQASSLWREVGDGIREAEALIKTGNLQEDDPEQALAAFRRALDLARAGGDQVLAAAALRGAADALTSLDRFQEAVASYDQAVPAEKFEPTHVGWARWAAVNVEPHARAAIAYVQAGEQAQAAETWFAIAQAASREPWGTCSARKAAEAYTRALELWRELGDPVSEAEALTGLAAVLPHIGSHWLEAAEAYLEAVYLWRELGNRVREAEALCGLADSQTHLPAKREAVETYGRAAGLWRELGDPAREAEALTGMADWQARTPGRRGAVETYARAADLWRGLGDRSREAAMLMRQGDAHGFFRHEALEAYTQAAVIYRELRDRAGRAAAERARQRVISWERERNGQARKPAEHRLHWAARRAVRVFQVSRCR